MKTMVYIQEIMEDLYTDICSLLLLKHGMDFSISDQLPEARAVFDKAVTANFKKVDDLANVWCEYVEMELRHKYDKHIRNVDFCFFFCAIELWIT